MNSETEEEKMADRMRKQKGSVVITVALTMIIIGLVLFIVGFVLARFIGGNGKYELVDYSKSFESADVSYIDADIEFGTVKLLRSEDSDIHIEGTKVPEGFYATLNNDGVLELRANEKQIYKFEFFGVKARDFNNTEVDIELPEKEFKKVALQIGAADSEINDIECGTLYIECGAGDVSISGVNCGDSVIKCGAGEVTFSDFTSKESVRIDGGVGEVSFNNSTTGGLDVNQGIGEFSYSGTVNGNIKLDGGIGEFSIALTNPETDFSKNGGKYTIDIDKGIGESSITYNN